MVAGDVDINSFCVPALVRKHIATLFLPIEAILIDLEDNKSFLGKTSRDKDGVYYIEDHQDTTSNSQSALDLETIEAMRAIMQNHNSERTIVS